VDGGPEPALGRWTRGPAMTMETMPTGQYVGPLVLIGGRLPLRSWVRTDRVVTLHIGLVLSTIGRTSKEFRHAVASDVCQFIRDVPAVANG
jgi:hypothetical protein